MGLLVEACEQDFPEIVETVVTVVERLADLEADGTDPGIVFAWSDDTVKLRDLYRKALHEIVDLENVKRFLDDLGVEHRCYGVGRGIVGAAAAVGADPFSLQTFEAIAYRVPEMWGKQRLVDEISVMKMDTVLADYTFDNYDYEKREVRITPHTPCPVLAGVRAVTGEHAKLGISMIRFLEPVDFVEVFMTNQATDSHYAASTVAGARPLSSCAIRGYISSPPRFSIGGHVFTTLRDDTGSITLAAYYPTGRFRKFIMSLIPGDEVIAYGSVKPKPNGPTMNLEKLHVVKLVPNYVSEAPRCPSCKYGPKMKSMGRGKGYRCERCGFRDPRATAHRALAPRGLSEGVYEVCVSARRHLVMPERLRLRRCHN